MGRVGLGRGWGEPEVGGWGGLGWGGGGEGWAGLRVGGKAWPGSGGEEEIGKEGWGGKDRNGVAGVVVGRVERGFGWEQQRSGEMLARQGTQERLTGDAFGQKGSRMYPMGQVDSTPDYMGVFGLRTTYCRHFVLAIRVTPTSFGTESVACSFYYTNCAVGTRPWSLTSDPTHPGSLPVMLWAAPRPQTQHALHTKELVFFSLCA